MKIILFFSFVSLFSGFSAMVNAADIPAVIEGQEGVSKEECVASATNDCIQSVCETSTDTNCSDQCQASAVDKCKEMSD